jgi:hypothetical protein
MGIEEFNDGSRKAGRMNTDKNLNAEVQRRRELNDLSPMPFGLHRDVPMQDVPASYLHWLWVNGKREDKQCPVAEYIRRNLPALQREHKDGIWS